MTRVLFCMRAVNKKLTKIHSVIDTDEIYLEFVI